MNSEYHPKGVKSWKYAAVKSRKIREDLWDSFSFHPEFLKSNWALFHEALQAFQVETLKELLPSFGVCLI